MTTWMVVEDEPDLYDMVLAMYDTLGINGVAFANGEEAMEWIDAVDNGFFKDEVPELALIDIRLPGELTGADISARLRQSKALGKIVIVMMTAYRMNKGEERELMVYTGADDLIYKPLPAIPKFERILRDHIRIKNNAH